MHERGGWSVASRMGQKKASRVRLQASWDSCCSLDITGWETLVDVDESRACRIVARCSRVETGRTQGLDARFRRRCHQKSKHPASTMVDVHDHNVVRSNTTPPGIIHTSQPVLDGSCHSERRFLPMLLTSVHLWLGATFGAKTKQDFETRPLWTLGDCLSIDPGRGHYK